MNLTTLIATERQDFFYRCESLLNSNKVYAQCSSLNLHECKRKMEMLHPDVMLIDTHINNYAMELVVQITEHPMPRRPLFLLSLDERVPKLENLFLHNGIMYIFDRKMHEQDLIESILQLYKMHRSLEREDELTPELVRILRECHISPRHRGYACIFDSVCLILQQSGYTHSLTKKVYPQIAIKHGTTAARVEKNIRDSIKNAWEIGGRHIMPAYLGCGHTKPPTNGQFVSAVCEKLKEILLQKEKNPSSAHIMI